jgi:ATP-dependent Clp protease ATP-binding subunit ClpA
MGGFRPAGLWAGGQALLSNARRRTMLERFNDRARRVVVLAEEEARMLDHNWIGTEHILLGLIREGDGVAPQVLVRLGADLNRVRQQVIQLISGQQPPGHQSAWEGVPVTEVQVRLDAIEDRLAAVEQRLGTGPDTTDLDEQIAQICREKESAVDAHDYEQAAALRNREKELLASKAKLQEQWTAGHPALPDLAERCQQLTDEVERLRATLRQHGIDPQDKPA